MPPEHVVGQSVCCGAKLVSVDTGVVGMVLVCSACGGASEARPDAHAAQKRKYLDSTQQKARPPAKKQTAQELLHEEALEAEAVQRQLKRDFLLRNHVHSGYPRIERNADGVPIWNQGHLGMSAALANSPLPDYWPEHWPADGILCPSCLALIRDKGGDTPGQRSVGSEVT